MSIDINPDDMIQYPPSTPGDVLKHKFLEPFGISQGALARAMRVPENRINEIVKGKRKISLDTALRLSIAFPATTPMTWMNLQTTCDLLASQAELDKLKKEVIELVPIS